MKGMVNVKYKESVEEYKLRSAEIRHYKAMLKKLIKTQAAELDLLYSTKNEISSSVFNSEYGRINKINKTIRFFTKKIRDLGIKNMHHHIALCLFRGRPMNQIMSPKTTKKINAESVLGFMVEITEW